MSLKTQFSLQCGFSLIEVLVAMVIIVIGLLGNADMQALSMNNTSIARNRGLAAIEADALASMMHANALYWQSAAVPSGAGGFTITTTTISDATLNGQTNDCTTAACASVQMAGYDLKQWGISVANLLPAGAGQVRCSVVTGTPVSCVISISWNENNLMLNQSGTSVTQSYTLVVQP
jgi:type IV pilus assembly protein PilV